MNILSRIHYKAKPVLLFMFVMLGILLSSVLEKHFLHDMNTSVSSLYQDRLLPATGLFQLNDLMYTKRQVLEGYLAAPSAPRHSRTLLQLGGHNQHISTIIKTYQATYLVPDEARVFQALQTRLNHYNMLEARLLATPGVVSGAQVRELAQQFASIHTDLSQLNEIQLRVGQEVSRGSLVTESNAAMLSNVKIALLVVFMLAIQYALLLDKHPLLPNSMKNFNLN